MAYAHQLLGGDEMQSRPPDKGCIRTAIVECLWSNPGLPPSRVRTHLRLAWGQLSHHLHVLEREGAITITKVGRRKLLFLRGSSMDPALAGALAAIQGEHSFLVAREVVRDGAATIGTIARATGTRTEAVAYHCRRLLRLGLIERLSPSPSSLQFRPTSVLREACEAVMRQRRAARENQLMGRAQPMPCTPPAAPQAVPSRTQRPLAHPSNS